MQEYSIQEIHAMMEAGQITAEQLVQQYLDQIQKLDVEGPTLSSILELNPDALLTARKLDEAFKEQGKTGPLHGIPILIKDNLDTADKMQTTAGSLAIEKYGGQPQKDAFVVTQLRQAGAIILGKTNLSEMANFRGQRSVSGWSSRGGRTKNPYVLNRNTSGSSSGSGAAVAANLCTVAIGTETDGSVISPSSINGIVGIKPSIGLVSRTGIVPIAHTQDTAGPMARSVADAAILLEAMVGQDPEDEVTTTGKEVETDYHTALQADGLQGARLGALRKNFGFHKDVDAELEKAIDLMKEQGAEIIDPVEMENPDDWSQQEFTVLLYEYKHDLNRYFPTRDGSDIQSIDDLIKYNIQLAEQTMPYFGQEHVENAAAKGDLTEEEYQAALKKYEEFRFKLNKVFDAHQLDAIIAPSNGPAWVADMVNGDAYGGGSSQLAAVSGFSNITVPAGTVHHLPIGISFIGRRFAEKTIIKLAYAFEQVSQARDPPTFLASLE